MWCRWGQGGKKKKNTFKPSFLQDQSMTIDMYKTGKNLTRWLLFTDLPLGIWKALCMLEQNASGLVKILPYCFDFSCERHSSFCVWLWSVVEENSFSLLSDKTWQSGIRTLYPSLVLTPRRCVCWNSKISNQTYSIFLSEIPVSNLSTVWIYFNFSSHFASWKHNRVAYNNLRISPKYKW